MLSDLHISSEKRKKTYIIEGNIGSGKSTILDILEKMPDIECIPEPVELWKSFKSPDGVNLLHHLYLDKEKYIYLFQSIVCMTHAERLEAIHKKDIRIVERSMLSIKNIFIKACTMSPLEMDCFMYWFEWLSKKFEPQIDGIIYIRSSPEVCATRIQNRARAEETSIDIDYLHLLHKYHEEWLMTICKNNSCEVGDVLSDKGTGAGAGTSAGAGAGTGANAYAVPILVINNDAENTPQRNAEILCEIEAFISKKSK
jgi:deoxyadenosine/deoxycytidine kinase